MIRRISNRGPRLIVEWRQPGKQQTEDTSIGLLKMHPKPKNSRYSRRLSMWHVFVLAAVVLAVLLRIGTSTTPTTSRQLKDDCDKATAKMTKPRYPPSCTEEQRALSARVVPMRDTSCPDATWLLPLNGNNSTFGAHPQMSTARLLLHESSSLSDNKREDGGGRLRTQPPLAIYIGCNKGIDAVDTLRWLSQNETFDKKIWIPALDLPPNMQAGVCGAGNAPHMPIGILATTGGGHTAVLHCVEPMPSTFAKVQQAAETFSWQQNFVVHNAAASDTDGSILFPNVQHKPRYESKGLSDTDCQNNPSSCQEVTLTTLDTFFAQKVLPNLNAQPGENVILDYLSIDVEGYDAAVLRGGNQTLARTKYLEFEVHSKGDWLTTNLVDVVQSLKTHKFWCYYAGKEGKLWRLTDCMTTAGARLWSNVACVNVELAPALAQRMEDVFLQTISTY